MCVNDGCLARGVGKVSIVSTVHGFFFGFTGTALGYLGVKGGCIDANDTGFGGAKETLPAGRIALATGFNPSTLFFIVGSTQVQ
jgi:hypothetical protein